MIANTHLHLRFIFSLVATTLCACGGGGSDGQTASDVRYDAAPAALASTPATLVTEPSTVALTTITAPSIESLDHVGPYPAPTTRPADDADSDTAAQPDGEPVTGNDGGSSGTVPVVTPNPQARVLFVTAATETLTVTDYTSQLAEAQTLFRQNGLLVDFVDASQGSQNARYAEGSNIVLVDTTSGPIRLLSSTDENETYWVDSRANYRAMLAKPSTRALLSETQPDIVVYVSSFNSPKTTLIGNANSYMINIATFARNKSLNLAHELSHVFGIRHGNVAHNWATSTSATSPIIQNGQFTTGAKATMQEQIATVVRLFEDFVSYPK